ncbi:MAG: glutamate--tRNA ligase [Pseudomonadota bacterium]|nr:glutamate--tRNA ligase [Pseudomonadota bacterium]
MSVAVRIAPSPTGWLHVGNIRTMLVNWLFARKHGGTFMLRLDDTDLERSREEYALGIERDLTWLGLTWDRFARQSDRTARYVEVIEQLKAAGRIYACYETEEELEIRRRIMTGQGKPPVYDRAALNLTAADHARFAAEGKKPHWRFLLKHEPIAWDDLVRGSQKFEGASLSDPVVVREDGYILYSLSSVIDDLDFGITHIIRAEEHTTNTASQIQMFQAIAGRVPQFAHLPLLSGSTGEKLSKRTGSLSIAQLRDEMGIEAMAIKSLLARVGTSDPVEPRTSDADLIAGFDLGRIARSTPRFDIEELKRLNGRILHQMPFAAVRERLHALGLPQADEGFWTAIHGNISRLDEAVEWWHMAQTSIMPVIDPADREFLAVADSLLPTDPWTADTWGQWVDAVKKATGRSGKALFMPLRKALTGRENGPELKVLLPLIGRSRAVARLAGREG